MSSRWPILIVGLAAGCGQPAVPEASVLLTIERATDAPAPKYLTLSWVGQGTVLADGRRVPASGTLPGTGPLLGTFEIGVRDADVWRTVVVRGYVGEAVVAEGAVRVFATGGRTTAATVQLTSGTLPDTDKDGIPDVVDDCPSLPNAGQGPCDGGAPPDARPPADAGQPGGRDAAAERPPADSGPDLPSDLARPAEGPRPSPDTAPAPPDAAPDAARGRGLGCLQDSDCDTGRCASAMAGRYCASVDMVVVPAGAFARGCVPGMDPSCAMDERPLQAVTLTGFEIDRTEVTQAAYALCVSAHACASPPGLDPLGHAQHPATNVTWAMADAYCRWAGKRLPTEAEWEKAARGPQDQRLYPWGSEPPTCARAQYDACGLLAVIPVAVLGGTSFYGAEDLAGNVAEWVSDWYDPHYYGKAPAANPPGPTSGTAHVKRGGAFDSGASGLRVSARASGESDLAAQGFRCARSL